LIVSHDWSFGDGATGTGAVAAHTYQTKSGSYTVTLTVTDNGSAQNSTSQTVTCHWRKGCR
jgi:PKD repeat protein